MPGRDFYLWQLSSLTVRLSLDMIDQLNRELKDPRHRPNEELGGIFLGRILQPQVIEITSFTFTPSQHHRGTIFAQGLRELSTTTMSEPPNPSVWTCARTAACGRRLCGIQRRAIGPRRTSQGFSRLSQLGTRPPGRPLRPQRRHSPLSLQPATLTPHASICNAATNSPRVCPSPVAVVMSMPRR